MKKYFDLIEEITVKPNIKKIKFLFDIISNLQISLNDLLKVHEEKNNYYLKEKEYNKFILNKLDGLDNLYNEIIKRKSKAYEYIKKEETNKNLNAHMKINENNITDKDIISNKIFQKFIENNMIKKIEKILMISEKNIKILDDSSPFLMVIKKINDEFETNFSNCNKICQNMKQKLICYKNLKNNEEQIIKIYNNIFDCYIQTFYDYFLKLSKTIISKLSKENLNLFKLNQNSNKIKGKFINVDEDKEGIIRKNENENENDNDYEELLYESLNLINGKTEYFVQDNNSKIIDLNNEFERNQNEENIQINLDINNNMNYFEEREKNYRYLNNMKNKILEITNYNNIIKSKLNDIENEIKEQEIQKDNKKKELSNSNNLCKEMNKSKKDNFELNRKDLEKEHNKILIKDNKYSMKYIEYKMKNEKLIKLIEKIKEIKSKYEDENEKNLEDNLNESKILNNMNENNDEYQNEDKIRNIDSNIIDKTNNKYIINDKDNDQDKANEDKINIRKEQKSKEVKFNKNSNKLSKNENIEEFKEEDNLFDGKSTNINNVNINVENKKNHSNIQSSIINSLNNEINYKENIKTKIIDNININHNLEINNEIPNKAEIQKKEQKELKNEAKSNDSNNNANINYNSNNNINTNNNQKENIDNDNIKNNNPFKQDKNDNIIKQAKAIDNLLLLTNNSVVNKSESKKKQRLLLLKEAQIMIIIYPGYFQV